MKQPKQPSRLSLWFCRHLLLLDGPFKGLDTETRKQIMDYVLLHFHKKPGRTVLLVTHDESEAAYMAENVFTLPVPL